MPGCCCYFVRIWELVFHLLMRFVNWCGDVKLFGDLSFTLNWYLHEACTIGPIVWHAVV